MSRKRFTACVEKTRSEFKDSEITKDFIPEPVGHNVLVQPDDPVTKSKNGLAYPDEVVAAEIYHKQVGTVIAVGDGAWKDKWTGEPFKYTKPKPGDKVIFARFAGLRIDVNAVTFHMVRDEDIVAVIPEGSFVKSYVNGITA